MWWASLPHHVQTFRVTTAHASRPRHSFPPSRKLVGDAGGRLICAGLLCWRHLRTGSRQGTQRLGTPVGCHPRNTDGKHLSRPVIRSMRHGSPAKIQEPWRLGPDWHLGTTNGHHAPHRAYMSISTHCLATSSTVSERSARSEKF